ncbi:energy transducer TonB [Massilia sp. W12]|uniref:energy transducer TonB n=1 Tax=Massilia sp. W12 TaxID=3126507 RepID=UPI0030CEE2C9
MDFSDKHENPTKKMVGFAAIVALHGFVGYAVVTGLATKVIDVIKKPVETKIIEEVKPPPPKELPPPPPPPEVKAPPPPFIPPPEVVVNTPPPPQPTISQTTAVKPTSSELPRATPSPTGTEPAAKPAPPAKTPAHLSVSDCEKPEYPAKAAREGAEGTVRIAFLVGADNRVREARIEKTSGNRDLDRAAKDKLMECNKFRAGTQDGKPVEAWATVEYQWKLD